MTKAELVNSVASAAGVTKKEAGVAVDTAFDSIAGALRNGEKTTIVGFGTFSVKETKARTGRNPQTGESLEIEAGKKITFKVGKELKEAIR